MKKRLIVILAVALLTMSVSAFAEGGTQSPAQQEQTQTESADSQVRKKDRRNKEETGKGQNGESDAVTGATQKPQDSSDQKIGEGQPQKKNQAGKKHGRKSMTGKESRQSQNNSASQDGQPSGKGHHQYGNSQKPEIDRNGQKNSKASTDQQAGTAKLDLEALVKSNVITKETAERITIYMNEHRLAQSAVPELLKTLVDAQIITQEEYEAMLSALSAIVV